MSPYANIFFWVGYVLVLVCAVAPLTRHWILTFKEWGKDRGTLAPFTMPALLTAVLIAGTACLLAGQPQKYEATNLTLHNVEQSQPLPAFTEQVKADRAGLQARTPEEILADRKDALKEKAAAAAKKDKDLAADVARQVENNRKAFPALNGDGQ